MLVFEITGEMVARRRAMVLKWGKIGEVRRGVIHSKPKPTTPAKPEPETTYFFSPQLLGAF